MGLSPRNKLAAAILRVTGVEPSSPEAAKRGLAPYFGAILRGLIRREMTDDDRQFFHARGLKPTIGVSKDGIMFWDKEFIDSFSEDRIVDLAYVVLHEAMHIATRTFERGESLGILPEPTEEMAAKASIWNIAADMCINEQIREIIKIANGKMPEEWMVPEKFQQPANLVAEERYQRLLKQAEKMAKKLQPKPGQGWCGGCAGHNHPNEKMGSKGASGGGDDEGKGGGGGGKSPDGGGRSPAALERMRRESAEMVRDLASKNRGLVPDSLVRWADTMLAPPKIPWQEKLARIVRGAVAFKAGHADLTWQRPSRRQAGVGYGVGRAVMPSLHAPVPRVSVLVDTSGSMSQESLATIASELQGVLAATGATVTVAAVDAELQGIRPCKTIGEAVALFKGGGGTVLMPGWKALLDEKPQPDIIIACTDGYIGGPDDGFPADEPKAKVIWVIVERDEGLPFPCPYGEKIYITKDDVKEAEAA